MISPPRFTLEDADRAHETWHANCGPAALAAIMGMTLEEVRPHMGDFERKGYTNPTLMFAALKSMGAKSRTTSLRHHSDVSQSSSLLHLIAFPIYGLARIQWEGPWTQPGVPIKARYRQTHWVGAGRGQGGDVGIFDLNCMNNGHGWVSLADWTATIVPHLVSLLPARKRGNGTSRIRSRCSDDVEGQNRFRRIRAARLLLAAPLYVRTGF